MEGNLKQLDYDPTPSFTPLPRGLIAALLRLVCMVELLAWLLSVLAFDAL